ncbi:hypothetical protein ACL03H_14020 [Saccharopolyspora sp. MS10]|uniref:hypothetical protein n=1 Tax=Saccharopolyspora sp. MS10 TaxID=3385973 RepID=UPI0039A28C7B
MLSIRELRDRAVIRPIKRAVEDQLLDLPGVTAVDIGGKRTNGRFTGEQAIVVSVARKRPPDRVWPGTHIPTDVLGIPTDVVEEKPLLQHVHTGAEESVALRGRGFEHVGAVAGGDGLSPCRSVQLAPPDARYPGRYRRTGTLGALVVGHPPTVATMGLTTFDVACLDDGWAVGDRMVDPDTGHVYADLARGALSGRVDAAAVTLGRGVAHSPVIPGIGPVTGQCAAYPGEQVRKRGYGSGVTSGVVTSVDATLRIDHGAALGIRVLREQIRIDSPAADGAFLRFGDAGGAVVNHDGRIVGLLFAGTRSGMTGFASPIADVLAELDVELCVVHRQLQV